MKKMPSIFFGHGSPMIALEKNSNTKSFKKLGELIIEHFGKPKAILSMSAHWFTKGFYVQDQEKPEQIYDMYGFPDELYALSYPASGDKKLAHKVLDLNSKVVINYEWGIDHGIWTVLCHVFPEADIPVVQISTNGLASPQEIYDLGASLSFLRDEGYLVMGSGNLVHNLSEVEWGHKGGSKLTKSFDSYIVDGIEARRYQIPVEYKEHPVALYAAPYPDHYYPLLFALGASEGNKAQTFNRNYDLGSISMSSFILSDEKLPI